MPFVGAILAGGPSTTVSFQLLLWFHQFHDEKMHVIFLTRDAMALAIVMDYFRCVVRCIRCWV
jgi:hypothetical protein